MRLARVLGAIGRTLISAGVIVLLFVGYQLWGTSVQHGQAQKSLTNSFAETLEAFQQTTQDLSTSTGSADDPGSVTEADRSGASDDSEASEASESSDESPGAAVAVGFDSTRPVSSEFLARVYPPDGDPLARIVIPAIGVEQITVEGVSVEDLRKGPGHYGLTPNPGQAGNSAIAGHRTTYGQPFHNLDKLKPGDEIIVQTIEGTFTYLVRAAPDGSGKGHFIVAPSETWVLDQTGDNLLTLTSCHPKYSAAQRLIVQAELVGDPVATIPREEAHELPAVELVVERSSSLDSELAGEGASGGETSTGEDEVGEIAERTVSDGSDTAVQAAIPIDDHEPSSTVTPPADDPDQSEAFDGDVALVSTQRAESFGEGLNGDSTRIRPAILWGLAAASIWLASWFFGKRLGYRWIFYLLGLAPFGLVLWSCFVNVDQALPAY